ncbi:MAG: NAD(P)/FAD-dependent oxidoreductase [bacterium]|nr:NAD(P)/FAD-dependent oxidoreductase [bacterium]
MTRIAVLGAGPAGLACAHRLLQSGHEVTVYEADDRPGGMSAHFDFDGLDIERFYHFVCTPDHALIALLSELEIDDRLEWHPGTMGYFYRGQIHEWGNPLALLRFPHLSLLSKLRYGLHTWLSIRRNHWRGLDERNAIDWVKGWVGDEAFDLLWRPLFDLKFFEYANNLSAAWIRSRVQRLGRSRRNIFEEKLGVLRGGSRVLIDALVAEIERLGGRIQLQAPAREISIERGDTARVVGVRTQAGFEAFDCVASTMPIPEFAQIVPAMPEPLRARYARLDNIGAICVLFKLRRPLTRYFWLNTTDPAIGIPGVIEYSNLQTLSDPVVYVPYYLPQNHPRFAKSDAELDEESFGYLTRINPDITRDDVLAVRVTRLRHAQPICPPGFPAQLPPIETQVQGLYVADTSWYYPADRSISESVHLGHRIAALIDANTLAR